MRPLHLPSEESFRLVVNYMKPRWGFIVVSKSSHYIVLACTNLGLVWLEPSPVGNVGSIWPQAVRRPRRQHACGLRRFSQVRVRPREGSGNRLPVRNVVCPTRHGCSSAFSLLIGFAFHASRIAAAFHHHNTGCPKSSVLMRARSGHPHSFSLRYEVMFRVSGARVSRGPAGSPFGPPLCFHPSSHPTGCGPVRRACSHSPWRPREPNISS